MEFGVLRIVAMFACFAFFYHVGTQKYSHGILLAAISIAVWFGIAWFTPFGFLGCFFGQVGLFVALTIWNAVRGKQRE